MHVPQISSTDGLWTTVAAVRDGLLEADATAEAQRLHDAMTISAHPGEVWPETRRVLCDLLQERPTGLDIDTAQRAADYLASWP